MRNYKEHRDASKYGILLIMAPRTSISKFCMVSAKPAKIRMLPSFHQMEVTWHQVLMINQFLFGKKVKI